ncbi:MAG: C40 family peptidase [Bacteroidetes bacterium]|nr:C40 family peptidase [Bacteroidota bacterium]
MAEDDRHNAFTLFEKRLKKSLVVDDRYSVLDFRPTSTYLHILTDSISNATRISKMYQKETSAFKIKVVLLPDGTVGKTTKGICHVGVSPVRKDCRSASEQVTQVLYGETFDALQIKDDWARVRLDADGYIGWVSLGQVTLFEKDAFYDFQALPKVYVSHKAFGLLQKPGKDSAVLREVVYGTGLSIVRSRGRFLEVRLPDGGTAFAAKSGVNSSAAAKEFSLKGLFETAYSFQGISYAWGGRSVKGFDCSGFVQSVFRLNGIELPRDSGTQFSTGVSVGKDIGRLKAGDLLFFSSNGDKITHVAVYVGKNKQFIHSSGYVRINSFDPKRKDFSEKLLSTFVGASRVI